MKLHLLLAVSWGYLEYVSDVLFWNEIGVISRALSGRIDTQTPISRVRLAFPANVVKITRGGGFFLPHPSQP